MELIPCGGTRKKASIVVFSIVTGAWLTTIIAVLSGYMTSEQANLVGMTTAMWWTATGITLGMYTASENMVKHSTATLNRESK